MKLNFPRKQKGPKMVDQKLIINLSCKWYLESNALGQPNYGVSQIVISYERSLVLI